MRNFSMTLVLALLSTSTTSVAAPEIEGDRIRVSYGDLGVWNDRANRAGLRVLHGDKWVDYSFPGTPFTSWRMSWEDGGSAPEEYFVTSSVPDSNATVLDAIDMSTDTMAIARHSYQSGAVWFQKTEAWSLDGSTMLMHFYVRNDDSRPLTDMALLYAFDPDQDAGKTNNTLNDTQSTRGDGPPDVAISAGPESGYAIVFGSCDPSKSDLGHFSIWRGRFGAHVELRDMQGVSNDYAMGIRLYADDAIAPGASVQLSFLVAVGDTTELALAELAENQQLCSSCDQDSDGWLDAACGGLDCDDNDAGANPDQTEVYYDGTDADCDGLSDFDADKDGYDSAEHGGEDCDDDDPGINPGVDDVPYDGVDSDCDGNSDLDADGDGYDSAGHGGDDCDDDNPDINPGATDEDGDQVDSDCDGLDGPAELVSAGCGCSTSAPQVPLWLGLVGLLVGLRRRRA